MYYFGTNLTEHGHYTWDLSGDHMVNIGLLPKTTPFNPEELTRDLPKGEVIFYQGGGFTVLGIAGSCKDERRGTKSIFWMNETVSKGQMIVLISQNQHSSKIINAMKFEVKWDINF